MKKAFALVALFAAATLASGAAIAHDHHDHGDGSKMAAFHAKHMARLHDKLKLTAAQEPAWKTFTEKTKPDPARRMAASAELAKMNTPERMDRMLALMKEGEARMAERVAAVKEFYAQLTPEQQKTFDDQAKAWHARRHGMRHPHHAKGPAAAPTK